MEIIRKEIKLCEDCNNYRGFVDEKYNGKVFVHCDCDLKDEKRIYGKWRSPCMISPNGEKLWWTPISDHLERDGQCRHNPWFGGPNLNYKIDKKYEK